MKKVRLKSVVRNLVEKSNGSAQPFLGLENLVSGTGQLLSQELPLKATDDSILHEAGDVLFSKLRPYLAKSYLPHEPGTGTSELLVLRPSPSINARFLFYLTLSHPWLEWANTTAYGTKMPRTSWEVLGEFLLWLPPTDKQRRIADFLDAETARIDRLMFLRKRQLTVALELLTATARELTGRSRILGRGEASSGPCVQLRRAIDSAQTGLTPNGLQTQESAESLPWYTPAALGEMLSIGVAEKFVEDESTSIPIFSAESILVTGIGESLGKVGYLEHRATGNQQLTALVPADNVDGRFIAWQLWASSPELRNWAQYSRIRILNNEKLKEFPIYLPDRSEQVAIAARLDKQLKVTVNLQRKMLSFHSVMSERRQALITAAVTGQFDVSSASGRGVEA